MQPSHRLRASYLYGGKRRVAGWQQLQLGHGRLRGLSRGCAAAGQCTKHGSPLGSQLVCGRVWLLQVSRLIRRAFSLTTETGASVIGPWMQSQGVLGICAAAQFGDHASWQLEQTCCGARRGQRATLMLCCMAAQEESESCIPPRQSLPAAAGSLSPLFLPHIAHQSLARNR